MILVEKFPMLIFFTEACYFFKVRFYFILFFYSSLVSTARMKGAEISPILLAPDMRSLSYYQGPH